MSNIYEEMKKVVSAEDIDNHGSDLYVPVTADTKKVLADYEFKGNVTTFVDQITGRPYYDIPFAYTPYWEETLKGNA